MGGAYTYIQMNVCEIIIIKKNILSTGGWEGTYIGEVGRRREGA